MLIGCILARIDAVPAGETRPGLAAAGISDYAAASCCLCIVFAGIRGREGRILCGLAQGNLTNPEMDSVCCSEG